MNNNKKIRKNKIEYSSIIQKKKTFPFWFPFFNFLKLEHFQELFLITMCCHCLQSFWPSESKKYQPFLPKPEQSVWVFQLIVREECRLPAHDAIQQLNVALGLELGRTWIHQSTTEQISDKDSKSPLVLFFLCSLVSEIFHYFLWDPKHPFLRCVPLSSYGKYLQRQLFCNFLF